jgi:biopolymer transport protein ExbD
MAMNVGPRRPAIVEINVTPMADIMIVLLIIFMTVTPLLREGRVKNLPPASNASDATEGPWVVGIAADATTDLGGLELAAPSDLLPRLQEAWARRPERDRVVYVKADERVGYSEVARVIALCHAAGASEVALLVRSPGI